MGWLRAVRRGGDEGRVPFYSRGRRPPLRSGAAPRSRGQSSNGLVRSATRGTATWRATPTPRLRGWLLDGIAARHRMSEPRLQCAPAGVILAEVGRLRRRTRCALGSTRRGRMLRRIATQGVPAATSFSR